MKALIQAIEQMAFLLPDYLISLENEIGPDWQAQINADITTPLAHYSVSGDGNAINTPLILTMNRQDDFWTQSSGFVTFTNSIPANHIEINAMAFYDEVQNTAAQRMSPQLELVKNGVVVAKSATGYQRHNTNAADSSNTIVYNDYDPGASPTYSLRTQRGANQTEVSNVDIGHIALKAIF